MSPASPQADESQSPSLIWSDKTNEVAKWFDDEPSTAISIHPVQKSKSLTSDAEHELELCSASTVSKLQRPMTVYRQALVDYYLADANKSGHSNKSTDKLNNVRFLRDSAENILRLAEQEGLKNSGLYCQVDKVHKCSRDHALYLSGDRHRNNQQVKSNRSRSNHDLEFGHQQSFGDRGNHFASTTESKSDNEDRSYHDSAGYDDRQHGKVAFDSKPNRVYSSRYHGTRRFLRKENDTMTAPRDGHNYHPLDDSSYFDDHETIVARGAYRDRSSYQVQVYPRLDSHSNKRGGRELLDSWRPPT